MVVEIIIDKMDCTLKDLKIPKTHRLLWDWEVCKLKDKNKELNGLLKDGFVWCMTDKGVRAAGLNYINDLFHVNGINNIGNQGRSRGVFVKK